MSDTGLIAVLKNNKVILKIFSGSNGKAASELAKAIKNSWPINVQQAYDIAKRMGFGTSQDLVVLEEGRGVFNTMVHLEKERVFPDIYFETFGNKDFNPRIDNGSAKHKVCINV